MQTTWIVVEDPKAEYLEGSLVDDEQARRLEHRGVILLPVVPDLFRSSGVGGYHRRHWGAGWSLNTITPRITAPLTIYASAGLPMLHWRAKLVLVGAPDAPLEGFLRFASDPSQAMPLKAGLGPDCAVNVREAFTPAVRAAGSLIVGGSVRASLPSDGHYGFGLYGTAPGLSVAWAAVSQAAT